MRLNEEKIKELPIHLSLGDIVVYGRTNKPYLITEISEGQYAGRSLDGRSGLLGTHPSMNALNAEFKKRGLHSSCRVYKENQYELVIRRIGAGE